MDSRELFGTQLTFGEVDKTAGTNITSDRIALLRQLDQDINLVSSVIKRLVAAYPNDSLRNHYAATICKELAAIDWQ